MEKMIIDAAKSLFLYFIVPIVSIIIISLLIPIEKSRKEMLTGLSKKEKKIFLQRLSDERTFERDFIRASDFYRTIKGNENNTKYKSSVKCGLIILRKEGCIHWEGGLLPETIFNIIDREKLIQKIVYWKNPRIGYIKKGIMKKFV